MVRFGFCLNNIFYSTFNFLKIKPMFFEQFPAFKTDDFHGSVRIRNARESPGINLNYLIGLVCKIWKDFTDISDCIPSF